MDLVDAYWDFVNEKDEEWENSLDKLKEWWLPWTLRQFLETRNSMRHEIRSYRMNELRGNFEAARYWQKKIINKYEIYLDKVERTAVTNIMATRNRLFEKQTEEFRQRNYKITECWHLHEKPTEDQAKSLVWLWVADLKVEGHKIYSSPDSLFLTFDKVEQPPEPPKVLASAPSFKKPRIL